MYECTKCLCKLQAVCWYQGRAYCPLCLRAAYDAIAKIAPVWVRNAIARNLPVKEYAR